MRQSDPIETDISETLEPEFRGIWLRREAHRWHDWDILTQTCTDMTEKLKKNRTCILILHTWDSQVETAKGFKITMKFFGRLIHICASMSKGVSVISVSRVNRASYSYRSRLDRFGAVILSTPLYHHFNKI